MVNGRWLKGWARGLGEKYGIGDGGERFENRGWGGIISSPVEDSASVLHLKPTNKEEREEVLPELTWSATERLSHEKGRKLCCSGHGVSPDGVWVSSVGRVALSPLQPAVASCGAQPSLHCTRSPVLGVFGVSFRRVLVGEGEGEVVELPFLPGEELLSLDGGRRRFPGGCFWGCLQSSWVLEGSAGVPLGEKEECGRPPGTSAAEFVKSDVTDNVRKWGGGLFGMARLRERCVSWRWARADVLVRAVKGFMIRVK